MEKKAHLLFLTRTGEIKKNSFLLASNSRWNCCNKLKLGWLCYLDYKRQKNIRVSKNDDWVKRQIPKLKSFYLNVLLPQCFVWIISFLLIICIYSITFFNCYYSLPQFLNTFLCNALLELLALYSLHVYSITFFNFHFMYLGFFVAYIVITKR